MHVVGQDDPGVDMEGPFAPCISDSFTQQVDLAQEEIRPAIRESDGKEDACAGQAGAAVGRHGASMGQVG